MFNNSCNIEILSSQCLRKACWLQISNFFYYNVTTNTPAPVFASLFTYLASETIMVLSGYKLLTFDYCTIYTHYHTHVWNTTHLDTS